MATAGITIATTASIMSTDERQRVSRRIQSGFVYGVMALAAAALIYLSVPRIAAYVSILPVAGHIDSYLTKGAAIPGPLLDRAISAYTKASSWQPRDAYLQQTLARLYMRRFGGAELSADARQAALTSALERIDLALAAAPNRHFSWTLRAEILRLSRSRVEEIAAALRMSALLGPREASSMLLRTGIIFKLWDKLPDPVRDLARQDLLALWQTRGPVLKLNALKTTSQKDEQIFNARLQAVLRRR